MFGRPGLATFDMRQSRALGRACAYLCLTISSDGRANQIVVTVVTINPQPEYLRMTKNVPP